MKKKSIYDEINEEFSKMIEEETLLMGDVSNESSKVMPPSSASTVDNSVMKDNGKVNDHSIMFSDTLGDYKPGDGVMPAKNNYTGNGLSAMNIQKRTYESEDDIISEDKTSIIKNRLILPDIEDSEEKEKFKTTLIDFFKKHPNYENKIDWNKAKTLTKADFESVLSLEDSSKTAQKKKDKEEISRDIKNIFKSVGNRKFEYIGENDNWLFVAPLTYEAAVYCDSSENQGAGARWCIGMEGNSQYWKIYYEFKHSNFILAFNKKYKELSKTELETELKYMIQQEFTSDLFTEVNQTLLWDQQDAAYSTAEKLNIDSFKILIDGFEKLAKTRRDEKEKQINLRKKYKNEIESHLSSLNTIDADSIPEKLKNVIMELDIPPNIKTIEDKSFENIENLNFVRFSEGLQKIGKNAFYSCYNLKSINLPNSLIDLNEFAFGACVELTSDIIIPKGITEIKKCTFMDCHNIKSVTFNGNNLKSIGWNSFAGLYKITSLELPDSLERIERGGFSDCKSLESVHIGNNVKYIGPDAFARYRDYKPYGITTLTITFAKGFDKSVLNKQSFDTETKFIFEE